MVDLACQLESALRQLWQYIGTQGERYYLRSSEQANKQPLVPELVAGS
jgi:hypothetical protein